jgi:enoyl-CoA hydratase/carnithine racemase
VIQSVLYEKRGHVAWLTLNRPDRANTINTDLILTLQKHALAATNDAEVRVLVVTGAGRHFCGGADLRAEKEREIRLSTYMSPIESGFALDWVPKPVIAAINGAAMGGGCEIALACDFRYIADTAKIGLPEIKFGSLPAGGGTARAPRLVGLAVARRLIMTGEPVDAVEAERIGLVDKVCAADSLLAEVEAFAELLASRAPYAMRAAKQLLSRSLELDLTAALEHERTVTRRLGTPEEVAEARREASAASNTYASIFSKPDEAPR